MGLMVMTIFPSLLIHCRALIYPIEDAALPGGLAHAAHIGMTGGTAPGQVKPCASKYRSRKSEFETDRQIASWRNVLICKYDRSRCRQTALGNCQRKLRSKCIRCVLGPYAARVTLALEQNHLDAREVGD